MRVAVIGSGPTGIAAAAKLSHSGVEVEIFDGGELHEDPGFVEDLAGRLRAGAAPQHRHLQRLRHGVTGPNRLSALRQTLRLLAGRVSATEVQKRVLGSHFAFRNASRALPLVGTDLPRSLAVGGLGNAWGAACYPLRREDLIHWPIDATDLTSGYEAASGLLGITGEHDDLEAVYPIYGTLSGVTGEYVRDPSSVFEPLLKRWRSEAPHLAVEGVHAGRSRLAVRPAGADVDSCVRCGLCAFGCALGAIWSPRRLLEGPTRLPDVRHLPGRVVDVVERRGSGLWLRNSGRTAGPEWSGPFEAVFLAAGAIGSFRIAATSLGLDAASARLHENDMFIVPFRLRDRHGGGNEIRFGLSEAVWALDPGLIADHPAHLQLYRVSEPLMGPVGKLLGSRSERLARFLGGGSPLVLGFLYLNSRDSRRITLGFQSDEASLSVETGAMDVSPLHRFLDLAERLAAMTGLVPLGRLARPMPAGFSAHLGGTLPLKVSPALLETHLSGELEGMGGVYATDLGALPFVPAQNATYTGMANAVRVAASVIGPGAAVTPTGGLGSRSQT